MALNVRATLNLDGRGFATGLQRAQQGLVSFGQKMAGIFVTGYIASAIRRIGKELADIPDKAAGMGLTTDQFQALDFAAKQTGAEIESVVRSMLFLARAQKEALTGNEKMEATFARLGYSLERVRSTTSQDLFKDIAAGVESGRLGLQNTADLIAVLGRNFQEYFKFLAQGGASIAQKFLNDNRAIEEDTLTMLDSLEDAWKNFWQFARKSSVSFLEGLAGVFVKVADAMEVTMARFTGGATGGWRALRAGRPDQIFEQITEFANDAADAVAGDHAERLAKEREEVKTKRDKRDRAAAQIREATLLELQEMQPTEKAPKERARRKVETDELARIGGFTGLGGARSAEASLRKIEKNTDKTAMASKRLADALGNGL